jgi:TetR/AcrR family transcriptional regulator
LEDSFVLFEARLKAALRVHGTYRERILHLGKLVFSLMLERIDIVKLAHTMYFGPSQGAPYFDFDLFHQALEAGIRGLIEEGIRAGEFRQADPEAMTLAMLGVIEVAQGIVLSHPERLIDAEKLKKTLEVVFEGITEKSEGKENRR